MQKAFHIALNAKNLISYFLILSIFFESCGQSITVNKELGTQSNSISPIIQRLDTFFQHLIDSINIPGLAVAITQNDNVYYARAFGVRNIDTKEPLQPDNLFHVASVSKPFVATAIVQLAEKGKMKLDEKLITYLPYFKLADERYKKITIKHMLNHTSGFPDVKENILLPLEMRESSFFQPQTKESLRTTPHIGNPPTVSSTYPYNSSHAPK